MSLVKIKDLFSRWKKIIYRQVFYFLPAITNLMDLYRESSDKGSYLPNEPEFLSYFILIFLESSEYLSEIEFVTRQELFFDPQVQLSLKIRALMSNFNTEDGLNNYSRLFSLIKDPNTPYLLACCCQIHLTDVRRNALLAMQHSLVYKENVPESGQSLLHITTKLGFDNQEQTIKYLKHFKVSVESINGKHIAFVGRKLLAPNMSKKTIDNPAFPQTFNPRNPSPIKSMLIESKRKSYSHIDIIYKTENDYSTQFTTLPNSAQHSMNNPTENFLKQPAINSIQHSTKNSNLFITDSNNIHSQNNSTPSFHTPSFNNSFMPNFTTPPVTFNNFDNDREDNSEKTMWQSAVITNTTNINTLKSSLITNTKPSIDYKTPFSFDQSTQNQIPIGTGAQQKVLFDKAFMKMTDEYTTKMIEGVVREIIITEHNQQIHSISERISNVILECVVKECITKTYFEIIELENWRNALNQTAELIICRVVNNLLSSVIEQELKAEKNIARYERFGFDRWRYRVLVAAYRTKMQELMENRMKIYLRQSSVTPKSGKLSKLYSRPLPQGGVFDLQLSAVVSEVYNH
jgi:hypothetical protein